MCVEIVISIYNLVFMETFYHSSPGHKSFKFSLIFIGTAAVPYPSPFLSRPALFAPAVPAVSLSRMPLPNFGACTALVFLVTFSLAVNSLPLKTFGKTKQDKTKKQKLYSWKELKTFLNLIQKDCITVYSLCLVAIPGLLMEVNFIMEEK